MKWIHCLCALLLFVAIGCVSPGVESEVAPELAVAPRVEAAGDVTQILETIQETVSRIENLQGSQATSVADRIEEVGHLVQNVEEQMYGTSPEDAKLKAQEARQEHSVAAATAVIVLGIILLAIFLPSVGGPMLLVVALGTIGAGSLALLLSAFLL